MLDPKVHAQFYLAEMYVELLWIIDKGADNNMSSSNNNNDNGKDNNDNGLSSSRRENKFPYFIRFLETCFIQQQYERA